MINSQETTGYGLLAEDSVFTLGYVEDAQRAEGLEASLNLFMAMIGAIGDTARHALYCPILPVYDLVTLQGFSAAGTRFLHELNESINSFALVFFTAILAVATLFNPEAPMSLSTPSEEPVDQENNPLIDQDDEVEIEDNSSDVPAKIQQKSKEENMLLEKRLIDDNIIYLKFDEDEPPEIDISDLKEELQEAIENKRLNRKDTQTVKEIQQKINDLEWKLITTWHRDKVNREIDQLKLQIQKVGQTTNITEDPFSVSESEQTVNLELPCLAESFDPSEVEKRLKDYDVYFQNEVLVDPTSHEQQLELFDYFKNMENVFEVTKLNKELRQRFGFTEDNILDFSDLFTFIQDNDLERVQPVLFKQVLKSAFPRMIDLIAIKVGQSDKLFHYIESAVKRIDELGLNLDIPDGGSLYPVPMYFDGPIGQIHFNVSDEKLTVSSHTQYNIDDDEGNVVASFLLRVEIEEIEGNATGKAVIFPTELEMDE